MDLERVVELDVPELKSGGSGCLLTPGLLLTARHVVGAVGSGCRWRRLEQHDDGSPATATPFRDAEVAWIGQAIDAALLIPKGGGDFVAGLAPVKLARLAVGEKIAVDLAGFPAYADENTKSDIVYRHASVNAATRMRAGLLTLNVEGAVPTDKKRWGGISGGPVFAGEWLVGLLELVPEHLASDALQAVPIQRLAEDNHAIELLKGAGLAWPPREVGAADVAALPASGRWASVRERYAHAMLQAYGTLSRAGLPVEASSAPPSVETGYMALKLGAEPSSAASLGVADLAGLRRAVITGEPGAGKSTALKQALHEAHRRRMVPIWLPLSELPHDGALTPARLLDAMVEKTRRELVVSEINTEFFAAALGEQDGAAVAFDALDEVGGRVRRDQVREALAAFSQSWPQARVWLSSRPGVYDEAPFKKEPDTPLPWKRLRVEPLDASDVPEFLRMACGDDGTLAAAVAGRLDLEPLTRAPLTLTMLAGVAAQGRLPDDAAAVFPRWVDTLCVQWEEVKKEAKGERAGDDERTRRLNALRALAWAAQQRAEPAAPFGRQFARKAISKIVASDAARDRLLDWLVLRTGLIAANTSDSPDVVAGVSMRFSHLQIQEYLAGAQSAELFADDSAPVLAALAHKWFRSDWREPLGFMVAELACGGDLHFDLLHAVRALDPPYEDLLHRRTLLLAFLLAKVPRADRVGDLVSKLVKLVEDRDYHQLDACAALIGLARHEAAREPLRSLANGTAMAHAIYGADEYPTFSDAHPWRLAATVALARVEGPAAGLRLLDRVERAAPVHLPSILECLRYRAEWGQGASAADRLAELFEQPPQEPDEVQSDKEDLESRKAIDALLRAIGHGVRADALIDGLLAQPDTCDLATLVWAVLRGRLPADAPVLTARLSALRQRVVDTSDEDRPPDDLDVLSDVYALAAAHGSPALQDLFEATLQHEGLIWVWGNRVCDSFPALARVAVQAMADYVANPNWFDRSRCGITIRRLCELHDDDAIVPQLLRLLGHPRALRWMGREIAKSLRERGQGARALEVLHAQLRPSHENDSDLNPRLIEAALEIDPPAVHRWLDAMYCSGAEALSDAEHLDRYWPNSGAFSARKTWFKHLGDTKKGREFLGALTADAINTDLSDGAKRVLANEAFDPPQTKSVAPGREAVTPDILEVALARATDLEGICAIVAGLPEREEALHHVDGWVSVQMPLSAETARELGHRLRTLSRHDLWRPEWCALLAEAIRATPANERGESLRLLEQRA